MLLDPAFSDQDRRLASSDFHDSLEDPLHNGEIIEIAIEISGYEKHTHLLAQFQDAVISDEPPTLKIIYRYEPMKDEEGAILDYHYSIFLAGNVKTPFTSTHRSFINVNVIPALRDVEKEMKGLKRSPLFKLVSQYNIKEDELKDIATELKGAADLLMDLDEIIEITNLIQTKFNSLSGSQPDNNINLSTFDIDPSRLLQTLQILMGAKHRPVSEISLGLCNILYITLMLLLIRDRTVPSIINGDKWKELISKDKDGLLEKFYIKNEKGKYLLNKQLMHDAEFLSLYSFLNRNLFPSQSFTLLAIEEPEAHLHPVLQRLIYREILSKSETSVIFTTHSTQITSVAPIESIVHVRASKERVSNVLSAAQLKISKRDKADLERYLDTQRGEIYFGLGVILVEGISEEYLVPSFASILGYSLDYNRVVICNINSTNFKPFIQLLEKLHIDWCLITDGDYYEKVNDTNLFHTLKTNGAASYYRGLELIKETLIKLEILQKEKIPTDYLEQKELFSSYGCFVGNYTLEVDIMDTCNDEGKGILKKCLVRLSLAGNSSKRILKIY